MHKRRRLTGKTCVASSRLEPEESVKESSLPSEDGSEHDEAGRTPPVLCRSAASSLVTRLKIGWS